jgi:hypothetical protein
MHLTGVIANSILYTGLAREKEKKEFLKTFLEFHGRGLSGRGGS